MTFSKRERIYLKKDFQRIFKNGKRTGSPGLSVVTARGARSEKTSGPSEAVKTPLRLGIVVGRKVGNAVFRNRIKRWIREAFRKHKALMGAGRDVVVRPLPGLRWENYDEAERNLLRLWRRAGLFRNL